MLERAALADTLRRHMQRHLTFAPMILAVVLATGCSTFRNDARLAKARPPEAETVEGLWVGRWYEMDNPEHGGRLQCVLTREGDTLYRLAARSHWWGIMSSSYDSTVVLTPVEPGAHLVQGGKSLWLWGNYSLTGRVDTARFDARYTIGDHRGVMELYRPGSVPVEDVEQVDQEPGN
jgi:hypothetical protein